MKKIIKISHLSDTHGKAPKPNKNADIVVLSGDICNTYAENITPMIKGHLGMVQSSWNGFWNFRKIDVEKEATDQHKWLASHGKSFIANRGFKDEDVIWVNGNHDFVDPTDIFPYSVYQGAKVFTIKGLKFGVVSGVLPYTFEWFDEVDDSIIQDRLTQIDRDIDILVTHVPCRMIMDKAYGAERIGSHAVYKAIFGNIGSEPYFTNLKAHLFGHAHDGQGKETHEINGRKVIFSNAACRRHDIDIEL